MPSSRGPVTLLSVVSLALGLAGLIHVLARPSVPTHPLELAPEGTTAVLRVGVPALLRSPLWAAWVGEGDEGYRRIVDTCGFDPLADLRTADVYLVGTSRRPLDQIGFVVRGPLRHEELIHCVETISADDGGGVHQVDIEGVPAIASDHGTSRAAFMGRDALLGGDESLVRDLIRRARGEGPSLLDDPTLSALWRRVQSRGELTVVARIPESWRPAIGRAAEDDAHLAPLASLVAAGLGARIQDGLGATLVLQLGSAGDARDLRSGLEEAIDAALARPLAGLSTLGGALRGVEADADGAELVVSIDLDETELAAVVARLRDWIAEMTEPGPPGEVPGEAPGVTPAAPEMPPPDEVIRPIPD